MKKVLSFDVGTTSMKCILFDENFGEIFYANREYSVVTDADGKAELNPEVYFECFKECLWEIDKKHIPDISAVTFTTQGETLIPVSEDGRALCDAIVWLDTRAQAEAEEIMSMVSDEEFYSVTGLCSIDGALPLAKLMWIKKNMPDVYESTYKFLLLEDYLIYRLTGEFVSEKSLQSSTGWYDIVNDRIYDKLCTLCGIDTDKLPVIMDCGKAIGRVLPEICSCCGLNPDTAVVTAAMDQISSAIGAGNIREGIVTETTGTALVMGATVMRPEFDITKPLTVYKHYDSKYIYMPYMATAGIVLKWFRDTIMPEVNAIAKERGISSYAVIDELAESAPCASNGLIMNPDFTDGGFIRGLTLATTREDLARCVLEGVAYMLRDLVENIEKRGTEINDIYSLGGGSYSPLWCRIKASVCGKRINSISYGQTTALGAAMLGFTAIGVYDSIEAAVEKAGITGKAYEPCIEYKDTYDKAYQNYKKCI